MQKRNEIANSDQSYPLNNCEKATPQSICCSYSSIFNSLWYFFIYWTFRVENIYVGLLGAPFGMGLVWSGRNKINLLLIHGTNMGGLPWCVSLTIFTHNLQILRSSHRQTGNLHFFCLHSCDFSQIFILHT